MCTRVSSDKCKPCFRRTMTRPYHRSGSGKGGSDVGSKHTVSYYGKGPRTLIAQIQQRTYYGPTMDQLLTEWFPPSSKFRGFDQNSMMQKPCSEIPQAQHLFCWGVQAWKSFADKLSNWRLIGADCPSFPKHIHLGCRLVLVATLRLSCADQCDLDWHSLVTPNTP